MTALVAWSFVVMPLVEEAVVVPVALWALPWRQLQLAALVLVPVFELRLVAEEVQRAPGVFRYETKPSAQIQE